ncbi:hypothetical protein [Aureimonas glaciei]|uniref:Uncharacterized protein n=1 Tax=Aureimonas glaciei TaxID=1776957 RepID=A0A916XUF8_9HYPH|nr:hypothetical protein [Aureimonas glaciei]GGD11772.1 hypothetical protein GCM10011335_13450 [Aureimonas glaciei]
MSIEQKAVKLAAVRGEGFEAETGGFPIIHIGSKQFSASDIRAAFAAASPSDGIAPLRSSIDVHAEMRAEIVGELRARNYRPDAFLGFISASDAALMHRAADEIERLQAEAIALRRRAVNAETDAKINAEFQAHSDARAEAAEAREAKLREGQAKSVELLRDAASRLFAASSSDRTFGGSAMAGLSGAITAHLAALAALNPTKES